MGDIIGIIKTRRNIKEFQPKFVSWEKVSRVIDAARHAPSSGNVQNWKFIVVFEPDQKKQLAEHCYEQFEIISAGVLIVVCSEPEKVERYYGERGKLLYSIQNCAAATQNMVLEAHSLGLGCRWIGGFDEEAVKNMFKIPEDVHPQAIIALGYPKEIPAKPPKYPLESMVYFHQWKLAIRDPNTYMNNIAAIMARKGASMKGKLKEMKEFFVDKKKK